MSGKEREISSYKTVLPRPARDADTVKHSSTTLRPPAKRTAAHDSPAFEKAAEQEVSDSVQYQEFAISNPVKADMGDDFENINRGRNRKQRLVEKDSRRLNSESWISRNGHNLTYVGVFLFTFTLYFRPYQLIPALSQLDSMALIIAIITLLVYLPTQLSLEGSITTTTTETKCILFIAFWALLTIPIAKDPGLAWEMLSGTFSKVAIIFVIMVNTLRSPGRLKGLIWLGIAVGVMLSYQCIVLYQQGEFAVEGYRVGLDFGGMFGNPNDMAIHLVMFTPIALLLGIGTKNRIAKLVYYAAAAVMVAGNMVTQSRGGFLGLLMVAAVLIWKLGKASRFKVLLASIFIGAVVVAAAPGNYGTRMLSIFIPGLDPVASSEQRRDLLTQSVIVSLRNPAGIGMDNFRIVGTRNLVTHNAYTQVSSELGLLALAAYLILLVSPLRKLASIERRAYEQKDNAWIYYMSVGLQASIAGYMVSSFFAAVAYEWYVYYPIAFAICLRRIYKLKTVENEQTDTAKGPFFRSAVDPVGA
jgi:O-antigen ligase